MRKLAGQVLGFVGTDNVGLSGLEALYDRVVASQPGLRAMVQDGRYGKVLHPHREQAPRPGDDLHLTLDAAIQHLVERELDAAVARTNAKRGSVVVLEPETGAVLAMASSPGLDPNRFDEYGKARWRNQVVADAYEPGSTFKMVTLAAALETGTMTLDQRYDCERGALVLHGRRIRDHHPFDILTVRQVLAKSSNVGAMKLGMHAGRQRLHDTIRAFGFGRPTGIDLPGESAGLLRPLDRWSALAPAYISFGQAISTTPLQMASAFAAVANGGRLLQPHIVARVGDTAVEPTSRRRPTQVVSPSTIRQVRSALESVVLEGTGEPAALTGYRVAGKTGTAQKAEGPSGYAANRYIASFIGFAPVEKPTAVIAVVIDEPWPNYHGSQAAAPVFANIARQLLLYLGTPAVREPPRAWPGETKEARDRAQSEPIKVRRVDVERVEPGMVPDFRGLTKRQSIAQAGLLGLRARLHGSGFVRRQVPAPGTPVELARDAVELWLASSPPAQLATAAADRSPRGGR